MTKKQTLADIEEWLIELYKFDPAGGTKFLEAAQTINAARILLRGAIKQTVPEYVIKDICGEGAIRETPGDTKYNRFLRWLSGDGPYNVNKNKEL